MTSSWFLNQGALYAILHDGFWKSDHDFRIAFHSNFLSGMHGFRDNEVLLQAGHDVIVISPPEGAAHNFLIMKGRSRLYNHVQLTLFVYLKRFRPYSTFCIWLGFPYVGQHFGVFWAKWSQNGKREKTLAGRALPYTKLRLLSHCAWNYLYPFGLCRCARKKAVKKAWRKKSQKVYISRMCGATLAGRFQINLCSSDGRYQTCTVS